MENIETPYNKLVGKKDGLWYFIDYSFVHSDSFKWLTGTTVEFLTENEYQDRCDNYEVDELWKMAVAAGDTTEWLEDWKESIDVGKLAIDHSYNSSERMQKGMKIASEYDDEQYKYSDCQWWGRYFHIEMADEAWRDYVYDVSLLQLITEFES